MGANQFPGCRIRFLSFSLSLFRSFSFSFGPLLSPRVETYDMSPVLEKQIEIFEMLIDDVRWFIRTRPPLLSLLQIGTNRIKNEKTKKTFESQMSTAFFDYRRRKKMFFIFYFSSLGTLGRRFCKI